MSPCRTVLVITDSIKSGYDYEYQLQQDGSFTYRVLTEPYGNHILALFRSQLIDGILLEISASRLTSFDVLSSLKGQMGDRCPPIVVIDGGDAEMAVQAFRNGATDYLVKDRMTPDDLRLVMRSAIENTKLRQELQLSQERFQTSVENMLDCFGIFSSIRDESRQIIDFRIDYLNGAACENNRMTKAMQIGRGLCEVLPAHRESGLFDEYCRLVETGEPFIKDSLVYEDTYGEQRLIRAFDIRATKLNDGFVASWRDITDRKRIELELSQTIIALQSSQQYQRDLAEAMPQIVWTADATGTVNYWNQRWYEYTHLSEAESLGLAGVSTVHPDERDRTLSQWREATAKGNPFEIEYRIRRWDGEYRWFISRAIPTRDLQGQITGWIGTITDIDNQKQAEVALRQSQERLDLAMKAAKMGSWDWDIQTGKVTWSTNLEYLFNMAPGSFDGRYETVKAMIHPEDLPWVEQAIHRAVYEQEDYNIEFRLIKPDGTVRWALGLGRVFYNETGTPLKMTGVDIDISDRKRAEAALRESEERFRNMADNAPVMIWVTDSTGYCTYLNRGWYDFTGQTEETALGLGWLDAVHPEDSESSKNIFLDAVHRHETFHLEYRLRHKNGEYHWAIDAATPWYSVDGQIKGYIGSVIDISNRKQAESALAANEARLRGFVDANVVGILYGDIYGNIYEANNELLRIIGYTRQDLQAGDLRWVDITPPEYLPLDQQGIVEARVKGACTPYEKEYIRKDGSRVPVLIGYSLVGEAREETVVFILDLSDRKQAEAALRKSENRLRLALESAELGTWDLDLITGVLRWDEQCKAMFGLSPTAEINYDVFLAGIHPEDRDRTHQVVLQSFDPESNGEYDIEYRTIGIEDRVERWVAAKGKTFFNAAGVAVRFIGTVLNITDKKRVEAEREQLFQREQAARAEAERANQIKDDFLAILSHELRSPLNPILGWTKLLQARKFDETRTAEALATIERNARLQTQLIDDLLDVAKILRGKLSLNITSVNLSFVVEAAIETVRTAAIAKSISLHPVLPNVGQVSGDVARLQQIVWNLLSNAIKFTPQGGRVEIELDRDGNHAKIIVRDTGRGINPTFLPYIFESFRQEDASITRKHGGLGLGLAIVRQLVEAHSGTITADSLGEELGATFTVHLPLLDAEPEIKRMDDLPPQDLDLTGIRVLTIDDDPDARDLLTVLLTQYGAEVLTVASAAEVLANLSSFQPDVLVSDIGMPDVDGYSLIQQIRSLPAKQGGQTPAIALTAYARETDYQQAITSGYQQHVTKPLEPDQLVQAVAVLAHSSLKSAK